MACTIEDVTDEFDPTVFDKPLGDLLIEHKGDSQKFMVSVFDFLKRKSNFFKQGDAKRRVLEAYREVSGESDGMKAGFFGSKSAKPAAKPAAKPGAVAAATPAPTSQVRLPGLPRASM